ncbi:MAG TPA: DUF2975 domain-containing protein [Rhabdochlamydiaceae bacterium]|jgi:hypothetical protein
MKHSTHKIQRLSRIFKIVFLICAFALPVIDAGFWITNGYPFLKPWMRWDPFYHFDNLPIKPLPEMDVLIKFFGFLISLLPASLNICAFILLAKLFHCYEQLEIFSRSTVLILRKLGICILLNQLLFPFYVAIFSLALTITNPPGFRNISVAFGPEQVNLLIIGSLIILVSWIMDEGRKLQEEQASTI